MLQMCSKIKKSLNKISLKIKRKLEIQTNLEEKLNLNKMISMSKEKEKILIRIN